VIKVSVPDGVGDVVVGAPVVVSVIVGSAVVVVDSAAIVTYTHNRTYKADRSPTIIQASRVSKITRMTRKF